MFLHDWIKSEALHPMPYPRWQATFVLKYGRAFTPRPLPPTMKPGKLGLCFANCQRALVESGLTYCEGYALQDGAYWPSHHAWLSTRDGGVVDLTWSAKKLNLKRGLLPLAKEYFGVPFKMIYVMTRIYRIRMFGALLEDIDPGSLWLESPPPKEFLEHLVSSPTTLRRSEKDDNRSPISVSSSTTLKTSRKSTTSRTSRALRRKPH